MPELRLYEFTAWIVLYTVACKLCTRRRTHFNLIVCQYYRRSELVMRIGVFVGLAPTLAGACKFEREEARARFYSDLH